MTICDSARVVLNELPTPLTLSSGIFSEQEEVNSAQDAGEPQPRLAAAPFDDLDGDVVVRATDGVHFYVYKCLLSLVSLVFKDVFLLCSGSDQTQESFRGKLCVQVGDDSESLFQVLSWRDPRVVTTSFTLKGLQATLSLAAKYDMQCVIQRVERSMTLSKELITVSPVAVYAIAIRYGFKDMTRAAARALLYVLLAGRSMKAAMAEYMRAVADAIDSVVA
ncbi:hypothetical protein CPC08DRAFT_759261 [Agrocybe pediades]|nr:hypothetical protein CPC08DRAFT_759261 [Agrocybe pediades]